LAAKYLTLGLCLSGSIPNSLLYIELLRTNSRSRGLPEFSRSVATQTQLTACASGETKSPSLMPVKGPILPLTQFANAVCPCKKLLQTVRSYWSDVPLAAFSSHMMDVKLRESKNAQYVAILGVVDRLFSYPWFAKPGGRRIYVHL